MSPLKSIFSRRVVSHSAELAPSKFGGGLERRVLLNLSAIVSLFVVYLSLSACGWESQSRPDKSTFKEEPTIASAVVLRKNVDAWETILEAERWGVMIDNAQQGVKLLRESNSEVDEDELIRIDRALRNGALALVSLRDELCMADVSASETCRRIELPNWVLEPPDRVTSLNEYTVRSQWLGAALGDFTKLGCEVGVAASQNEYFCSVE